MFSFHKPKVYRSSTGCCICKAKSSSSRFTDSKKYEDDFIDCFQLQERRTGEICNACVLLVKRWKKLPAGSNRNWRHVVDARAGPGIKSLTKFKSKNKKKIKDLPEKFEKIVKKKHIYLKTDREREESPTMSDDLTEDFIAATTSKNSSRAENPAGSYYIARKQSNLASQETDSRNIDGFIDLSYFKRETICCGTIYKGPYGEIIVNPTLIKPCMGCLARQRQQREMSVLRCSPAHSSAPTSPAHSTESASPEHSPASVSPAHSSASASPVHISVSTSPEHSVESGAEVPVTKQNGNKTFSDSSSDSGYDESSNQGLGENKVAKPVVKTTAQQETVKCDDVSQAVVPDDARLKQNEEQPVCKPLSPLSTAPLDSVAGGKARTSPLVEFVAHTASSAARQPFSN